MLHLLSKARDIERAILAERFRKETLASLKTLHGQRLSFKPEDTEKRRSSFKGRVRLTLYKPGIQQEEADLALERGKPQRAQSKKAARAALNRRVKQERKIEWKEGYVAPDVSGMNKTADSVVLATTPLSDA